MLKPVNYVAEEIWRRADFYRVFPLDGGGHFSFLDIVGTTDDRAVAEATVSGKLFERFRDASGQVDWERYDRWDTIEMGVWLNRWYYLPSAARVYWLTGDEKFARSVRDIVAQWCAAVPAPEDYPSYFGKFRSGFDAGDRRTDERAHATWCDFQLAQRVLAAYWSAWFLRRSASWKSSDWSRLADLMTQHARWLYWTDRHGDFEPGNHQMLRGFALLHAAAMLKDTQASARWWDLGARMMTMHATGDFTAEGISREGSFSYQVFMLSQFAHAIALAEKVGKSVPPEWRDLAVKMAHFVKATTTPAGTTPVVNDGYEAAPGPVLDICGRQIPELATKCGAHEDDDIRLADFSEAGVAVLDARNTKQPLWLLAESMPPYGHSGHWHAGKPTVHVWVENEMLLGDAGCPNYDDPLYGSWYRRGPAHFTVTVDGKEDADFASDIRWRNPPSVKLTRCRRTRSGAEVHFESNGFLRLDSPVAYTRDIAFSEGSGLVIRDRLTSRDGGASHVFRLHVPFTVSDVRRTSPNSVAAAVGGGAASVSWQVTNGQPVVELTRKPVHIGSRRGQYPYLQVAVAGVPETEFILRITSS